MAGLQPLASRASRSAACLPGTEGNHAGSRPTKKWLRDLSVRTIREVEEMTRRRTTASRLEKHTTPSGPSVRFPRLVFLPLLSPFLEQMVNRSDSLSPWSPPVRVSSRYVPRTYLLDNYRYLACLCLGRGSELTRRCFFFTLL